MGVSGLGLQRGDLEGDKEGDLEGDLEVDLEDKVGGD